MLAFLWAENDDSGIWDLPLSGSYAMVLKCNCTTDLNLQLLPCDWWVDIAFIISSTAFLQKIFTSVEFKFIAFFDLTWGLVVFNSPVFIPTRSKLQNRAKYTFTWRFSINLWTNCGCTSLKGVFTSKPETQSSVYCFAIPLDAVLFIGFFFIVGSVILCTCSRLFRFFISVFSFSLLSLRMSIFNLLLFCLEEKPRYATVYHSICVFYCTSWPLVFVVLL